MIRIPHIIAHRGASIEAPENTIAAFRIAQVRGVNWIECDVTLSADAQCVLIHDDTLDRTTNGSGPIHEHSLATLRTLDAGAWFSDIYKGERIPTLSETLDTLAALEMGINLEIKPSGCDAMLLAERVASEIGNRHDVPVLLSSFDPDVVAAMADLCPALDCGWLVEEIPADWKTRYDALKAAALHVDQKQLTAEKCAEITGEKVPLICYTVNDPDRARTLLSWGVRAIITDNPALMTTAIPPIR
ncbi:glycerophosphodiester phosphodiesterase family protein [uncultured Thalassospira sp.]|uniref:glycerophosphodiester phosphodiesterase family protein n=1 Tax=uncultured Thalassospira sp. TaxID=404382 RepID=UPI0030DC5825|tara:strand:- start:1640 stop:2374 length:735 start_codon:yes stop_codon:yes gene_type:complete